MFLEAIRSGPPTPDGLSLPPPAGASGPGVGDLPDDAAICSCHNVAAGAIRAAVDEGFDDIGGVKSCTAAGTGCGSCVSVVQELIDCRLRSSGVEVVKRLCAHFP